MTKNFGFTLAEVLITLGIIGVVAAMTMPTLINQTNGAQYKAAYKKALSAISQAITLNVALDDIGFAELDNDKNKLEEILGTRMNVVSTTKPDGYTLPDVKATKCTTAEDKTTTCADNTTAIPVDKYLFFNDGSMFAFSADAAKACTQTSTTTNTICYGVIDVNGAKGPNKVVTCDGGTSGTKASGTDAKECSVKSPTDIYPVMFYDQTILPASDAAKAVLYGK